MTFTHLSHYGLTPLGQTADNVLFSGSLGACKRMAFAHGMEIKGYEGFTISSEYGHAVMTPADAGSFSRILFKQGGMIQAGRDDYTLVMPVKVWTND